MKLLRYIPSTVVRYESAPIEEVGQLQTDDLPSPRVLNADYHRWQAKWNNAPAKKRQNILKRALQQCDKDSFPDIHALLLIPCTLPVTVCEKKKTNCSKFIFGQLCLRRGCLASFSGSTALHAGQQRLGMRLRSAALAMMKIYRTRVQRINLDSLLVALKNKK